MENKPTIDDVLNKLIEIFGDQAVDPAVYPKIAHFQFKIAKWHLDNGVA